MLDNGHAEKAPNLRDDEEFWFLPIFSVYHPRKPGQARVVFDSSAQFCSSSLNEVLLAGPDLTNSLLGVHLRFRQEPVAVVADVHRSVPDQGCAGPVAYIIRGAPSPRTCNICHFNGCKRNSGGKTKEGIGWQF